MRKPMISVVIPAHNESKSLPELIRRVSATMAALPYEIIVVDDGSTDGSASLLRQLKRKHSSLRPVFLLKNRGQTAALQAGFDAAKGEVVVSMDADLQNLPEDVPKLIHKLEKGYDVVCGWRTKRKDSFTKRFSSFISNSFIRFLTGCSIYDHGCTLRAYRGKVIRTIRLRRQQHRFIPLIAVLQGWKVTQVAVAHVKRQHGATHYSARRFLNGAVDLTYSLATTKKLG